MAEKIAAENDLSSRNALIKEESKMVWIMWEIKTGIRRMGRESTSLEAYKEVRCLYSRRWCSCS
jgi:hypothetical protein